MHHGQGSGTPQAEEGNAVAEGTQEKVQTHRRGKAPLLGGAKAGCVSSQGSESNNSLCLIAVPSSEVIGTAGGACSGTPIGSGP